jgi:uncharacterized repeat protein (TIGR01451 family)
VTALPAARSRRRATAATLVAVVAALLAPVAFAAPASAATLSNGIDTISTGFAIDGNKTATNGTPDTFDWDDFIEVDDLTTIGSTGTHTFTPTGPYTTVDGFESTGIVDGTFGWDNGTLAANCSKPDATAFPGSVKPDDNPWPGGSANVLPKANGCSFGNAHEIITDDDGLEHHILYQYWTRLEGNGDMTTYQSLEGGEAGRCDDYLVEFNYDPAGTPKTTVQVLEWVADGGDCSVGADGEWSAISPNFPYQAEVGTRVEGPGLPAEIETFGEMAIDLTLAGLFDEESCTAFQTTGYITRTGNSTTAELGDLVGGDDPLTLSNCGTISITKDDSPADSGDDTLFGYVITNGDVVHDDALTGSDGTDELADSGDDPTVDYTSIEGEIGFGETHTWGPVYSGDYAIEEIIPDGAPWALWSLECTVDGDSYTIVDDGEPVEDAVIPVVVGYETACVLTNATSALTVTKVVEGAETQSFAFDIDGDLTDSEIDLVGTTAGATSTPVAYAPGTSVTVTELLGDLDWELTDVTCSDGTTGSDGSVTVTTEAGTTVDCVFTNLQFGTIEVTKSTVGGDGTFEFELQSLDDEGEPVGDPITESATTTGGTGVADFGAVAPGSRFSIAETAPGGEWIAGDLECTVTAAGAQTSSPLDESDFTVEPGDTISCEITNTATGTIIVVKNVVGDDATFSFTGDWLTPDDFDIETDAGTGSQTFDDVIPGSYTLTEVPGEGYDGTNLVCSDEDNTSVDGLTATLGLDPGETITCTYTNSEWGVLVVDKVTVPEGSEQEFEFEWAPEGETATGFELADETDAYSTGPVAPGEYVVSETSDLSGWSLTDLVCTDPADNDTDPNADVEEATATVNVGLGETVTCTFTNAQRGPLTFDKKVAAGSPVNNGDGTWTISYDLTVTSESNIPEDYDLEDELDFGAGIVPVDEDVVSNDGVTVNAGWDGDADIVVATGATIPALGSHTYTVTVTAEVDAELDPDAADCEVADGEGSGFLNAGSIEFWSGTDTDDACAALPISDLEITKDAPFSVDFEPAVGPTEFDYTILVENLGPDTAHDAVLEDPLPAGLDFVSASGTDVTCGFAAGIVTCELGDLGVGQTRTVTITVSIPTDYPFDEEATSFQIDNVATTSTVTPESDLTNNEDDAETTVLITLPLPPDDPEEPDLPTLALSGAAIGAGIQLALSLLAVGVAFALMSLRRRPQGRHSS